MQWRLMLVAAVFIVGACLAYSYQAFLVPLLLDPLGGEKLVYLNPAGGFSFIFLISIYAGIALSFPMLVQQIYAFLRPVLPSGSHKKSSVIIVSSFLLLIAGIAFGYFVAVPSALQFLYGFADQYVEASLTAESYLNFIIAYTIGIGIVFQIPLLLLLINSIKPLTPGGLMKSEKWVLLLSFIVAAIITPTPDPINQAIIAGPVIAVYQIGVVAVLISIARQRRAAKRLLRKGTAVAPVAPVAQAPIRATPLAATLDMAPLHAQVGETPATAPITPSTLPKSHIRSVDGFTRSSSRRLQVPARPVVPPRASAEVQRPVPTRGLYVDGFITRRTA